jgi:hypothetical protein
MAIAAHFHALPLSRAAKLARQKNPLDSCAKRVTNNAARPMWWCLRFDEGMDFGLRADSSSFARKNSHPDHRIAFSKRLPFSEFRLDFSFGTWSTAPHGGAVMSSWMRNR